MAMKWIIVKFASLWVLQEEEEGKTAGQLRRRPAEEAQRVEKSPLGRATNVRGFCVLVADK